MPKTQDDTLEIVTLQVTPNVVMSTITNTETDSTTWIVCNVPGGTPRFHLSDPTKPGSGMGTPIVDAPECDDRRAVHDFVRRWYS